MIPKLELASAASIFILFICLVLYQPSTSLSLTTLTATSSASAGASTEGKPKPFILPLRTQKVSSLALPGPRNKLLFHHNVSLTVSLSVGTPPQNVSMVLDTGSELSWLLCNATAGGPSFHLRASSSYAPIPCSSATCRDGTRDLSIPATCDAASSLCHVSLSYADASTSEGTLAADSFRLGQSTPLSTIFGCMVSAYSSTSEGDDSATAGLLGMNRGSLSFITQTATQRFSYCIAGGAATGVLLLGDAPPSFLTPLNYTPLVQISLPLPYFDRVAYTVQLDGIRVAAVLLPIPKSVLVPDHTGAGQTMVDSGTQFTFLLGPAYDALKAEFLRQTKGVLTVLNEPDFVFQGAFDMCFRIPAGAAPPAWRLPAVSLMFGGGAEVRVVGERLLYRAAGEARGRDAVWCFTFGNSDLVPLSAYVIGHHHQQDVWVDYDLRNSRVGFAPVQCAQASQRLGALL
uniref:Aspartic proteinase PCS1 n=1 Tax=Elaeis guineensis var. tenera TaxID=51953 RepID=A0A6I9RB64_ELAGV|nr:aspartic proteinase PCS1 [Elaeis guineensis]